MREIKEKKFIKLKSTKQIIFIKNVLKSHYQKKFNIFINQLKQRGAVLISAKEINILDENYFVCHKLDHIFKECSYRVTKINAINNINANEFNRFDFNLNFVIKNLLSL